MCSMKVELHPDAAKYLRRMNEPSKGRIKGALKDLEKEPPRGDIERISGKPGNFRLVVGSYRVLYRVENDMIIVIHIVPRGQAYTKKTLGR